MDGTYNSWKLNRLASRRRLAYDSAFTVICREPFHPMICMELRQLLDIQGTILQPYGRILRPVHKF